MKKLTKEEEEEEEEEELKCYGWLANPPTARTKGGATTPGAP
jgi:hypothetical protein